MTRTTVPTPMCIWLAILSMNKPDSRKSDHLGPVKDAPLPTEAYAPRAVHTQSRSRAHAADFHSELSLFRHAPAVKTEQALFVLVPVCVNVCAKTCSDVHRSVQVIVSRHVRRFHRIFTQANVLYTI